MDKLPTETVRVIAELIDREDILSLRLTCRSFAALGLPRQFEVIPVMLFRNSLENLLRISEHPVYRNYVLTIKYGGEFVSNPRTRIDWTKNEWSLPGAPKKTFSESEVEEAYQSHVRYYDDQKLMKATGYDFKTLLSAISRLPNLRGVRIMPLFSENSARFANPPPAWGDEFCSMAKVMANPYRFFPWEPSYFVRETVAVLAACKFAPKAIRWFDSKNFELGLLSCDGDDNGDGGGGGGVNGGEDEVEADYRRHIVRLPRFSNFVRDPTKDLGPPLLCATFQSLTTVKLETSFTYNPNYGLYQQRLGTALSAEVAAQPCFDIHSYLQGEDVDWSFPEALVGHIDLNAPFAKWAQDVCGARCMSEVLQRYIVAGAGGEV
ncbi:hypothetical protein VE04_09448, partial [Pseudogymnoascus sp. 24MN13]